jgi:hypothetical protein
VAKPNLSNYRCINDPAVIGWDIYIYTVDGSKCVSEMNLVL